LLYQSIILIGLSGSGKSTVAKNLAELMSWDHIDTDEVIKSKTGNDPAMIIKNDGENAFRDIEQKIILNLHGPRSVISIGGGAFQSEKIRQHLSSLGLIFFLDAPIDTLLKRVLNDDSQVRPLLGDSKNEIHSGFQHMNKQRRTNFIKADIQLFTFAQSPEQLASSIFTAWLNADSSSMNLHQRKVRFSSSNNEILPTIRIMSENKQFPIWVGTGILKNITSIIDNIAINSKVFMVMDENIDKLYAKQIDDLFTSSDIHYKKYVIQAGESEKNLDSVKLVYDWLVHSNVERKDLLVTFGGGVVCDLGGFVAATILRGIKLLSIPTTLLAMTDAAIGGKTAVNLPEGKNMIGSFKQPNGIIIDTNFLATLPERETIEGMAEVIKHAIIFDKGLFDTLESFELFQNSKINNNDLLLEIITTSIQLKSMIVSVDPLEKNIRKLLNFGHTIGHALESSSKYNMLLHGEAVAIGMMAASRISNSLNFLSDDDLLRIEKVLLKYGLPIAISNFQVSDILELMMYDKKIVDGQLQFILLNEIGQAFIESKVDDKVVRSAIAGIISE
jgi:shikimate kinase / 3-dehydroquinate synthase